MLAMDDVYNIIRQSRWEGLSARAIANLTGHSLKTVLKYIHMTDFSDFRLPKIHARRFVSLEGFTETIDAWMNEDLTVSRKQRHTKKRVFERLRDEKGYTGSYTTVKGYMRRKEEEQRFIERLAGDGALPLAHPKGWGQVDFGEFVYKDGQGKERKAHTLIVCFPYSNKAFAQLVPAQNLECFLEAMKRIFMYIGAVPRRLLFDNLKPAVSEIKKDGQRSLTQDFAKFVLHYGFEPAFCNPDSGNEKGSVEAKVKYIRSNALVPVPTITDFDKKNAELLEWCEKDAQRAHYKDERLIEDLWREEAGALLPLPVKDFPICHVEFLTVDKYGFVTYRRNKYGLPPRLHGREVMAKAFYDRIVFIYEDRKLAEYPRSYGKNEEVSDWAQYLDTLFKKPRGFEEARFYDSVPPPVRHFVTGLKGKERKLAFVLLREMVGDGHRDLCEKAVEMAAQKGRVDVDSVRQCYCVLANKSPLPEPLTLESALPSLNFRPNLASYDALTAGGRC